MKFVPPWNSPIEMIEAWARTKPAHLAVSGLVDGKRWIMRTYCQLLRRVMAIAQALADRPAERLAIACGSHVSTVETVLSAMAAGREFVPIDLFRKPLTAQLHKLADSKATVMIIPALGEMPNALVDHVNDVRKIYPYLKVWSLGPNALGDVDLLDSVGEGHRLSQPPFGPEAWNLATALLYSPGRHGQPRGYFYTTGAIGANTCAVQSWLKLNGKSRLLLATELDCCDGLIPVLATLSAGGTAILHSQIDGGHFWKIIPECDADMVRAKPSLIEDLLNDDTKLTSINRSNLKFIITGSSYLPRQIGLRFFETFDLPLLQSYGTAETGGYVLGMPPGLSWREYELALRDNIAGHELDYCNVTLRPDPACEDRPTLIASEGILHVRGHVLSCGWWDGQAMQYWNDPWLSTLDMAVHSPGLELPNYQIRGRLEDTLLIDNQRFWPAYIERSLLDTFQFLRDCVVMSTSDTDGRQRLCAVVVLPSDIPAHRRSELMALMGARLGAGGVSGLTEKSTPHDLIPFDEQHVPRRYDGHPDRMGLQRLIEGQHSRGGLVAS